MTTHKRPDLVRASQIVTATQEFALRQAPHFVVSLAASAIALVAVAVLVSASPAVATATLVGAALASGAMAVVVARHSARSAGLTLAPPRSKQQESTPKLVLPPGTRTARALSLLFGRFVSERVFGPIVGDATEEWIEAALHGDDFEQWAIRWRTPLVLIFAAVVVIGVSAANALRIGRRADGSV